MEPSGRRPTATKFTSAYARGKIDNIMKTKINPLACIILAAGKGERMKSATPKVLHQICGRPMLHYVLDVVSSLKPKEMVCVLGHQHEQVAKALPKTIKAVLQRKQLGTADAVKSGLSGLKSFKGTVLVLCADTPLLKKETLGKLIKYHTENACAATILTVLLVKPAGYGRILRDRYNSIFGIIEEKDADDFQKEIKEINTGIICFDKDKLIKALAKVRPNNRKKEYYLTDVISILSSQEERIEGVCIEDVDETMGINSRVELAKANSVMQRRINEKLMREGVSIVDPATAFINYGTKIGPDSVIYPFTVIDNDVIIAKRCFVGPFAHLREGARLEDEVILGNFTEIARSKIGSRTIAKHFCYVGDSRVGRQANIGAGVVTANFDGTSKHSTLIKDNAFIGSDTILVAPVVIGKYAKTGAGSVVTSRQNVKDGQVVVGIPARPLVNKNQPKTTPALRRGLR